MLKDGLYHKKVYMPFTPPRIVITSVTNHARMRALEKGFVLPEFIRDDADAFEAEVRAGGIVKVVYRQVYDARRDICVAVAIDGGVKTAWLNSRSDAHRTLDRAKYVTEPR